MKKFFALLFLFWSYSLAAQPNYQIELVTGINFTRLHTLSPYNLNTGRIYMKTVTPQLGYETGVFFSKRKKFFSIALGVNFRRIISYANLIQEIRSLYNYQNELTYNDVNYLRLNVSSAEFRLLLQAGLGKEKKVRLMGGFILTSSLINRSRANYYSTVTRNYYDPTTGTYIYQSTSNYIADKLAIRQMNVGFCGGLFLPVYETKWSISALWRYCFTPIDKQFGLADKGMSLSVAYAIN